MLQNIPDSTIHLGIDPGSYKMGIAVFNSDGKFLISELIRANQKMPAARRLYEIQQNAFQWLGTYFPNCSITVTVIEHLPPSQLTSSLPISPGCVVAHPANFSRLTPECAVGTGTWKAVAKQLGCEMRDPKGLPMFKEIPWEFEMPKSEDEADAIMIYLAYSWNHHGYAWLGETLKAQRVT